MKTVRLIERRPFLSKGAEVWFYENELFEVIEEKELPIMGKGYKIYSDKYKMEIDGFYNAKCFQIFKADWEK